MQNSVSDMKFYEKYEKSSATLSVAPEPWERAETYRPFVDLLEVAERAREDETTNWVPCTHGTRLTSEIALRR